MLYKLRSSVSNNRVCPEQPTHHKTKSRFSWGRQLANSIYSATIQACAIRGAAAIHGHLRHHSFWFSTFERLIGDGRFGRPIRCAFPAMELRETPSASPICEIDKPRPQLFQPFQTIVSPDIWLFSHTLPHLHKFSYRRTALYSGLAHLTQSSNPTFTTRRQ